MSILGGLSWWPSFLRHRTPQKFITLAGCSDTLKGPGEKKMYSPTFLTLQMELQNPAMFICFQISSVDGNHLSWLSQCLVPGVPVLRNDCEIPTVALCFDGLNVLLGWSGTGSVYIWGFNLPGAGVERGMPQEGVSGGADSFRFWDAPSSVAARTSKEMWGAEGRAGGRGQPPVFIVEMSLPISRRLLRWLTL